MRERETGDDFERHYGHGNVGGNGESKFIMKWLLGILSGIILLGLAVDMSQRSAIEARVSALESSNAAINAKLDWLIDYARRTRGVN